MPDSVKVLVVERNGVELSDAEEFNLIASAIPFTGSGFVSNDVQSAIIEASAGSADVHSGQNETILDEIVTVSLRKEMAVFQEIKNSGEYKNSGDIIVGR